MPRGGPGQRQRLADARKRLQEREQSTLALPEVAASVSPAEWDTRGGSVSTVAPKPTTQAAGKMLSVQKREGYIVVRFERPLHVVAAFAGRSEIDRPRHAICWTCRPTGRHDRPVGHVCEAEAVALAQLDAHGYRDR